MILLVALVVSLLVALVRGGKLLNLANISLRLGWLALLAFAAQALVIYAPLPRGQGLLAPRSLFLLTSYGVLIVVILANRRLPGMCLIGLGLLLNLTVMVANGGFMPVAPEALAKAGLSGLALGQEAGARLRATKDILLPREMTRLWPLSDVFAIPPPLGSVFSLGDLVLAIGLFVLLQRVMVQSSSKEEMTSKDGGAATIR
ncbi:MAG: DUF5317 domain-containing protein [Chloroflexi bacterium]|nr:DUF5317 domain-containing protein [Chloroflexota bacterium]